MHYTTDFVDALYTDLIAEPSGTLSDFDMGFSDADAFEKEAGAIKKKLRELAEHVPGVKDMQRGAKQLRYADNVQRAGGVSRKVGKGMAGSLLGEFIRPLAVPRGHSGRAAAVSARANGIRARGALAAITGAIGHAARPVADALSKAGRQNLKKGGAKVVGTGVTLALAGKGARHLLHKDASAPGYEMTATDFVDAVYTDLIAERETAFDKEAGIGQQIGQHAQDAANAARRAVPHVEGFLGGAERLMKSTAGSVHHTRAIAEDVQALRAMRAAGAVKGGLSDRAKGALLGAGGLGVAGLVAYPHLRGARIRQHEDQE